MNSLDRIGRTARTAPQRIVLAEGADPRIVQGALRAAADGIAEPILVGSEGEVSERVRAEGGDPDAVTIADPKTSPLTQKFAVAYHDLRRHKGVDQAAAEVAVRDPLIFAAMMQAPGLRSAWGSIRIRGRAARMIRMGRMIVQGQVLTPRVTAETKCNISPLAREL